MRSWHVKPKGLAPSRCRLSDVQQAMLAIVGTTFLLILIAFVVAR